MCYCWITLHANKQQVGDGYVFLKQHFTVVSCRCGIQQQSHNNHHLPPGYTPTTDHCVFTNQSEARRPPTEVNVGREVSEADSANHLNHFERCR